MAGTPTVYVICDQNCKFEGMTKEQILTAIKQAVELGEIKDVDAGFVSTIKTINGQPLKFFVGEKSEYDELTDAEKQNLFAIIKNDKTENDLIAALEEAIRTNEENKKMYEDLTAALLNGDFVVGKAEKAERADNATNATNAVKALNADNATNADNLTHHKYINYVNLYGSMRNVSYEFCFYLVFISNYEETRKTYSNFKTAFIASVPKNTLLPISGTAASQRFHAMYHNGTNIYAREMYWNGTGSAEEFNYEFDTEIIFSEQNNSWQIQKLF